LAPDFVIAGNSRNQNGSVTLVPGAQATGFNLTVKDGAWHSSAKASRASVDGLR
jgi:hypothetical protein